MHKDSITLMQQQVKQHTMHNFEKTHKQTFTCSISFQIQFMSVLIRLK